MNRAKFGTTTQTSLAVIVIMLSMAAASHAGFGDVTQPSSGRLWALSRPQAQLVDSSSAQVELPSPGTAALLSTTLTIAPTVVGIALACGENSEILATGLIGFGVLIGPSTGYLYGDCPERGLTGVGLRAHFGFGTILLAYNTAQSYESKGNLDFSGLRAGLEVAAIGGTVVGLLCLYDMARVYDIVHKRNEQKVFGHINMTPGLAGNLGTPGLTLSWTF